MTVIKFKPYTLSNYKKLPQIARLSKEQRFTIEVVGHVFPFKTNNYVVENLIDWDRAPDDPMYRLTFPQKGMLLTNHFDEMAEVLTNSSPRESIAETANKIRWQLNPHPAGQLEYNQPKFEDYHLQGVQHKYKETVLFFPSQGQLCHAFCSFCFRWPQFVGIEKLKISAGEVEPLIDYVRANKEITDILITGGDPLVMSAGRLRQHIEPVLNANIPHLATIRIGTKSLSYWPYRFVNDHDTDSLLRLFEEVPKRGKQLAIMAHFNHPKELSTDIVKDAIKRIRESGAQIRTQAPMLKHINDDSDTWVAMLREQVRLNMIPYYMFIVRDTGAQHHFGVPLVKAMEIYKDVFRRLPGLARTIRGPSMSFTHGKAQVMDIMERGGKKVIMLQLLQGRNPDWALRPFFAEYDEEAIWIDQLKPVDGKEKFFFEE